uniref:Peptidase A1 domain-containing protein n=1 Tax=Oxyrrhis marina TaxID=2969 RepID=A0A7S4LQ40_OXYMA
MGTKRFSGLAVLSTLYVAASSFLLKVDDANATSVAGKPIATELRLSNFENVQYYGLFKIGPFRVNTVFDTGSFDILTLSKKCTKCGAAAKYDSSKSKTYEPNGTKVAYTFGSGKVIAELGYETAGIGQFLSKHQLFGEIIDHEVDALTKGRWSTIVGMPKLGSKRGKSWMDAEDVKQFALCLEKRDQGPGHLRIGPDLVFATGQDRYKDLPSISISGKEHWAAKMTQVSVKGKTLACTGGCGGIVDTGTSGIVGPPSGIKALRNEVGEVHKNCSNAADLPPVQFSLGGATVSIPSSAYVIQTDADQVPSYKGDLKRICVDIFMQMDVETNMGPLWILGMPFMRQYYTIFDRDTPGVRFGEAGSDCKPKASTAIHLADHDVHEDLSDKWAPLRVNLRDLSFPSWVKEGEHLEL